MSKRAKRNIKLTMIAFAGIILTVMLLMRPAPIMAAAGTVANSTPASATIIKGTSSTPTTVPVLYYKLTSDGATTLTSITMSETGIATTYRAIRVYINTRTKLLRGATLAKTIAKGAAMSSAFDTNVAITTSPVYVFIVYDIYDAADASNFSVSVSAMGGLTSISPGPATGNLSIVANTACVDTVNSPYDCGKCHNYQGWYQIYYPYSSPTIKGSHDDHVTPGSGRIECWLCHNYADNYLTHYTSTVKMHQSYSSKATVGPKIYDLYTTTAGAYAYSAPNTYTCSNVDCHKGVTTPKWGSSFTGCGAGASDCHNTPPSSGAHSQHFSGMGMSGTTQCVYCHSGAGTGTTNHVNGSVEVTIKNDLTNSLFKDKPGGNPTYSGGTDGACTNVSCHGGITTFKWSTESGTSTDPAANRYRIVISGTDAGTYYKCQQCHDVEDLGSPYTATTKYNSARSGKHKAHVDKTGVLNSYTGIVGGTAYNLMRIKVSVCFACHYTEHTGATRFPLSGASTTNITTIDFEQGPSSIGGSVGGNTIFTYTDGSTTQRSLGSSPAQGVYYMDTVSTFVSGSCGASNSCHGGPVDWSYTAILSCTQCHDRAQGNKADIVEEFADATASSHHVQGITANASHCYQCHWEASNTAGAKNSIIHANSTNPGVHLVKYLSTNARPTVYTNNFVVYNGDVKTTLDANSHCLSCHNANMKGMQPFAGDASNTNKFAWDGSSVNERYSRVQTVNSHNYNETTYNVVPRKTKASSPHYAANSHERGVAVGVAWTDDATEMNAGAYNASNSQQGSVACLDCHNSHGSNLAKSAQYGNSVVSYTPAANQIGGILKQTSAGKHGYGLSYTPKSKDTYNWSPQAAMCFDCHLGEDALDTANTTAPKNYMNFGRTKNSIVAGYYDPVNWANTNRHGKGRWYTNVRTTGDLANLGYSNRTNTSSPAWWQGEFSFKGGTVVGSHFKKFVGYNTTGLGQQSWAGNASANMQGKCAECHDPHGMPASVNIANGSFANRFYYNPILKNTWMTSPYFEDRPGDRNTAIPYGVNYWYITLTQAGGRDAGMANNSMITTRYAGAPGGPRTYPSQLLSKVPKLGAGYGIIDTNPGQDGFFIDDNTFGVQLMNGAVEYSNLFSNLYNTTKPASNFWFAGTHSTRAITGGNNWTKIGSISESDAQFGQLCINCHPKATLLTTNSSYSNRTTAFQSRSHKTVKGWWYVNNNQGDLVPTYYVNRTIASRTLGIVGNSTVANSSLSQQLIGGLSGVTEYGFSEDDGSPQAGFGFSWGLNLRTQFKTNMGNNTAGNTGNLQVGYHNFPCAKCHAPHTSRLPRLMKTNCLDIRTTADTLNGSWFNTGTSNNRNVFWQKHTVNATGNYNIHRMASSIGWTGDPAATFSNNFIDAIWWNPVRAVRCHNSPLIKDGTSRTFWNDITPWFEN